MLDIKWYDRDKGIIEVVEVIHSFVDSKITYWYYDINNWMKSNTGKKDADINMKMDGGSIDWVRKYYLPKLEINNEI